MEDGSDGDTNVIGALDTITKGLIQGRVETSGMSRKSIHPIMQVVRIKQEYLINRITDVK